MSDTTLWEVPSMSDMKLFRKVQKEDGSLAYIMRYGKGSPCYATYLFGQEPSFFESYLKETANAIFREVVEEKIKALGQKLEEVEKEVGKEEDPANGRIVGHEVAIEESTKTFAKTLIDSCHKDAEKLTMKEIEDLIMKGGACVLAIKRQQLQEFVDQDATVAPSHN